MKTGKLILFLLFGFVSANIIVIIGNSLVQIFFSVFTMPGMQGRSAETPLSMIVLFLVSGIFLGVICMTLSLLWIKDKSKTVVNFMGYGAIILSILLLYFNIKTSPGNDGILENPTFETPALSISYFIASVASLFFMMKNKGAIPDQSKNDKEK